MRSSESARPRIVLVGAGMYGTLYLNTLTQRDMGGDLTAVVDVAPDLETRFPVLAERHIPVWPGLEEYFRKGEAADLAIIASPIHLHERMIRECLDHGLNVLCEKPLCLTEDETRGLDRAARESGRFLAVGWQLDYEQPVLDLKRDILAGRFGAVRRARCMHAMRRGMNYYARANWAGRIAVNGQPVLDSPFMNACAHNFQLMTFLLGSAMPDAAAVTAVDGALYRGNPTVENYDIAFLRCQTDAGAPLYYYTAHPLRAKNLGQNGVMEFEHATLTWGRGAPYLVVTDTGELLNYGPESGSTMLRKLSAVIGCVRTGDAPPCGPIAGLGHLQAVRYAQALDIQPVADSHVEWLDDGPDRIPCVSGLEEALIRCAAHWALPAETGISL